MRERLLAPVPLREIYRALACALSSAQEKHPEEMRSSSIQKISCLVMPSINRCAASAEASVMGLDPGKWESTQCALDTPKSRCVSARSFSVRKLPPIVAISRTSSSCVRQTLLRQPGACGVLLWLSLEPGAFFAHQHIVFHQQSRQA